MSQLRGRCQRPVAKPNRQLRLPLVLSLKARPLPVFSLRDQLRPPRIALHIARDSENMLVRLDRKGSEAVLIDRACPGGVVVNRPALCMRNGDPSQQL